MAYEQYPYHYVYDGKTGLTKDPVAEKTNKTALTNATTVANNTTKLNENSTEAAESLAQGEKNVTETEKDNEVTPVPVKG